MLNKKAQVQPSMPMIAPATKPVNDAPAPPINPQTSVPQLNTGTETKKKSKLIFWLIVILVILIAAGVGYYLLSHTFLATQ